MFGCTRFLCQDATNYLQQVALVIESIGFSLVFIEIQYPAVKDKVDQWIDKFISRTKYVRLMAYYWRKVVEPDKGEQLSDQEASQLVFSLVMPLAGMIFLLSIILFLLDNFQYRIFGFDLARIEPLYILAKLVVIAAFTMLSILDAIFIVALAVTLFVMIVSLFISAVGKMFDYIDRVANGHAYAGIVLAAIGLSFESYQVAVLWWGPE